MTIVDVLRELRQAAAALEQNLADERPRRRQRRSVIRRLDRALAHLTGQAGAAAINPGPEPPGRSGSVYGEEYRLHKGSGAEAVHQGHEIPPTPDYSHHRGRS
jgi:hypothetical protein